MSSALAEEEPTNEDGQTFSAWVALAEQRCAAALGLDMDSVFGDWPSWSLWDAGFTPQEAVREVLLTQGDDALIPNELTEHALEVLS